jgi:hypothetical protein
VKFIRCHVHRSQLLVGYLDPGRIAASVKFCS